MLLRIFLLQNILLLVEVDLVVEEIMEVVAAAVAVADLVNI